MSKNTVKINTKDLRDGMVISHDIISEDGVILVSKDFEIKDILRIQELLKKHNIKKININDFVQNEEMSAFLKNYKEISEFKENIDVFLDDFKKDFQGIGDGEEINKNVFENKIEEILQCCNKRVNVFQLMEKIKDIDDYIYLHCYNVTVISYSIGKWLNFKDDELKELTLAALFCDLGKTKISFELLNKKEPLTYDELFELKKHVIHSYEIIKDNKNISNKVKQSVLYHHERLDGSGYPRGLTGENIPLFAKIIAIADVYNALTSKRPYRNKKTPFEAIKILEQEYVNKLDTGILYTFLNKVSSAFIGNKVKLNDERVAEIVFIPKQNIYRPVVKIDGTNEIVDLSMNKNLYIQMFL